MELKNIDHYVCPGECKGISEKPGVCQASDCSKKGSPLINCTCTDGKHKDVLDKKPTADVEI